MKDDSHHISGAKILSPAHAYDLAASRYESWHWQEFWRRTETPFFDDCVEAHDFAVKSRFLDAGCGSGYHADRYGILFDETFGIDPSVNMLNLAASKLPEAHFSVGLLAPLPYASGMFDLVMCARVLSHVESVTSAIHELVRVTSPGGLLLISNVDEGHRYTSTRLPSDEGDIYAETFKHPKSYVVHQLAELGLQIGRTRVILQEGGVLDDQGQFSGDASSAVAWCVAATVPH